MRRNNVVAAIAIMVGLATASMAKPPRIGEPAPPFTLKTVDGQTVSLADLRGQVVVLNFWATWCGPCKRELPTLDGFYALTRDHGLKVFAITTEDSLPISQLKKLFAVMQIPGVKGIRGAYGPLEGVPTNYVIDRAGVLRYAKAAAFDLDALNALLIPLLNEAPPAG